MDMAVCHSASLTTQQARSGCVGSPSHQLDNESHFSHDMLAMVREEAFHDQAQQTHLKPSYGNAPPWHHALLSHTYTFQEQVAGPELEVVERLTGLRWKTPCEIP